MVFAPLALFAAIATSTAVMAVVDDTLILNYALTLEHLESAFYSGALAKFNASEFAPGGEEHALFTQIAEHEATHVTVLESVLGKNATKACTYNFPYTTVAEFKALAMVLEGVGTSAYLGAAQFISNPAILTAAGAILTTEARHAAYLSQVNGANPWGGAFDTPMSFNEVYSLAAPFITSCPSTNPVLPFKAFPALTVASGNNGNLTAGGSVTLNMAPIKSTSGAGTANATLFVAFLFGVGQEFVEYKANQSVVIPAAVNGTNTLYAVITTSNGTVSDDTTVAGPAILMFSPGFPTGTNITSRAVVATNDTSSSGAFASRVVNGAALLVGLGLAAKMVL